MTVIDYCTEEVRRQGHDIHTLDGIERVGWMLNAWSLALSPEWKNICSMLSMHDAISLDKLVEPTFNKRGVREVNVRVGSCVCPRPADVPRLLELLFNNRGKYTPMEFYKMFEEIHPFVDGNGRTGKILLNMLNGSLLEPIFPPRDLWGREIENP